ncbi:Beta-galactoside alpha-2,6-sialyltransferase 2 [Ilyodon furcidens]|uniref:Beta-galactoside alpha-2,6-sialyltransferase 2 n=1 Tax=Ilyodon furcidens TaxID=33524 RepID=A0ABV0SY62_9TELE
MKSSMKQWRRLLLVAMLAWVLVFLALLSHFLDARVDEPLTSAGSLLSQHPDTRRLASIQASNQQHAIFGLRPELALQLTTTYLRDEPGPEPSTSFITPEISMEVSQETSRQDNLDPQSLAAWSSFGTENVGSHSDPAVQSRERMYQNHVSTTQYHGGEDEEDDRENEDLNLGKKIRTAVDRRTSGESTDLEDYYFSKSASVVQRLWKGRVSADMLSPRLQRAMKDYVSANKHHVSYNGHRKGSQSAKELLCQMKALAQLKTVDGLEEPFSSLGWADIVPSLHLEQLNREQDRSGFKSCAVVTSAGAILRSRLGKEIGKCVDVKWCLAAIVWWIEGATPNPRAKRITLAQQVIQ